MTTGPHDTPTPEEFDEGTRALREHPDYNGPVARGARPDAAGLAQQFHEAYERLAPEFGYKTREASSVPWERVPSDNKALMTAVADEILTWLGLDVVAAPVEDTAL